MSIVSDASALINLAKTQAAMNRQLVHVLQQDLDAGEAETIALYAVEPHLDALRDVAGFRVKDALYLRVLQDEGEA